MFWKGLQECLLPWFVEQSMKSTAVLDFSGPGSPGMTNALRHSTLISDRGDLSKADKQPEWLDLVSCKACFIFFFVPCPLSNNTTAHSSQEVEGGLGSERAGFTGNAKLCLWARWSKQRQGRVCSKANVDPHGSHDIQGAVAWALGGARSGHRSGHPREGILRPSPAQVHASGLFSFMPSFEKKITLDKETVRTTVENGNTLAVRFVCCVSSLSPLALKPSFTLERPQDGVRRVHGRGGSSLRQHSCFPNIPVGCRRLFMGKQNKSKPEHCYIYVS